MNLFLLALLAACSGATDTAATDEDTDVDETDDTTDTEDTEDTEDTNDTEDTEDTEDTNDTLQGADVRLSELLASNDSAWQDPDTEDYADAIELINVGDAAQDLSDWTVSDSGFTFTFAAGTMLGAGEVIVVVADDTPENGPLHAGFKLSKDEETVTLADDDGATIDSVSWDPLGTAPFGVQPTDTSLARLGGVWVADDTPTIGAVND